MSVARPVPLVVAALVAGLLAAAGAARAGSGADGDDAGGTGRVPPALAGIRIEDRAGSLVPLDLPLVDHEGARRTLADVVDGGLPVVLVLGYYRCPMLCGVVFERLRSGLAAAGATPGRDYRAAAVSIDPRETAADARARRESIDASGAWAFFVADESASRRLADAVGFRYRFDPPTGQYAHAAGVFVLTPDGRVSRTLYGLDFDARTLQRTIAAAAGGDVEAAVDAATSGAGAMESVLIQCFRFMPALRRHGAAIAAFLRGGAAAVVLGLAGVVIAAARRRRLASPGGAPPPSENPGGRP